MARSFDTSSSFSVGFLITLTFSSKSTRAVFFMTETLKTPKAEITQQNVHLFQKTLYTIYPVGEIIRLFSIYQIKYEQN